MKKFLSTLFACVVMFSITTSTFAHTHLTGASPEDGATLEEAITSLTLTFDGQVGEGSFVELTASTGEEIAVQKMDIGNMEMIATLAEPLANGEYKVNWSIISSDGHPLEGSYMFSVNAPVVEEQQNEVNQEDVQEEAVIDTTDVQEQDEEKTSSTFVLIIAIILALIIVASLVALLRRKK